MTGDEPRQQPMPGPPPGWTPPPGPPPGWQPPHGQPPPAGAYPWLAYPPPGYVPPKRRRSRWLTIGLPLGLVLLLGGCGVLVTLFVSIRFTTADGLDNTSTLPLTKENGAWHPCP